MYLLVCSYGYFMRVALPVTCEGGKVGGGTGG